MAIKSIQVKQTKDQIADLLRTDILAGVLRGGDELVQEQIAQQTGLSRMPVREALQTLEQEGLLVRLPNRHMRVIEITGENIRQYFAALTALEASFREQLLRENRPLEAFVGALVKAIQANSGEAEYAAHIALSACLDNEYLSGLHKKLLDSFYAYALRRYWKHGAAVPLLEAILRETQGVRAGFEAALRAYFVLYENALRDDGRMGEESHA